MVVQSLYYTMTAVDMLSHRQDEINVIRGTLYLAFSSSVLVKGKCHMILW